MSPTYKRLLVAVDAGLLLYWAAVFLNLIPEHLRFKDYSNQVIQAWNWSFYRDFDPLWWGPNALLMIVPALAFGSMVCRRLETAENRA